MNRLILYAVFFSCLVLSCIQQSDKSSMENSIDIYDSSLYLLGIDFNNNPKESIDQIIHLSGIRKSGYGILLNLENSYLKSELDTIKMKFQIEDINAIHSFDIKLSDTIKNHIYVAMDGARFIWILNGKMRNPDLSLLKPSLDKAIAGKKLIVSDLSQMEQVKHLLQKD